MIFSANVEILTTPSLYIELNDVRYPHVLVAYGFHVSQQIKLNRVDIYKYVLDLWNVDSSPTIGMLFNKLHDRETECIF